MSADLRTWAEMTADAKTALRGLANHIETYVEGSSDIEPYRDALEASIKELAAITGRMVKNPANTLSGEDKRNAVGAALFSLVGLKVIDRIHPDLWEEREEFSQKWLAHYGVDLGDELGKRGL